MSEPFSLVLDVNAHKGKLPETKTLITNLVNDVKKNEHGTLSYECFIDEAHGRICFLDTYASSEAFLEHMGRKTVGNALNTLMANCDVNSFTIMGNVTPQVRTALAEMGATYVTSVAGFTRAPVHATH